jgi:hypothetical protein
MSQYSYNLVAAVDYQYEGYNFEFTAAKISSGSAFHSRYCLKRGFEDCRKCATRTNLNSSENEEPQIEYTGRNEGLFVIDPVLLSEVLTDNVRPFEFLIGENDSKCSFLRDYVLTDRYIFNAADFGCPPLIALEPANGSQCIIHTDAPNIIQCSKTRSFLLARWCYQNPHLTNFYDARVRRNTFRFWRRCDISADMLAACGWVFTPKDSYDDATRCV